MKTIKLIIGTLELLKTEKGRQELESLLLKRKKREYMRLYMRSYSKS